MRGSVCSVGLAWFLVVGCDSVRGPHQGVVLPAVRGRVVDATTLEPVKGARVHRSAGLDDVPPAKPQHGGAAMQAPAPASTDRDGRFCLGVVRGGYLLFEQTPPLLVGLQIEHPLYRTFSTNVDLLRVPSVQTGNGPEVDVGEVGLTLKRAPRSSGSE